MIQTIFNKIKEQLETLSYIKGVYEYPQNNPTGYPYCFLEWIQNESEVLNNEADRIIIIYKITVVQEKIEELKGRKDAEKTIMDRQWKLEELFRSNNNLQLDCILRIEPIQSIKSYQNERVVTETTLRVQAISSVNYK